MVNEMRKHIPNMPVPKSKSGYYFRQYRKAAIRYQPNKITDSGKHKNRMMPAQCWED